MEQLLKKYYEYYLKLNNNGKKNEEENKNKFFDLVINKYDLSNDTKLSKDIEIFKGFQCELDENGKFLNSKYSEKNEEETNELIKKGASLEYFDSIKYVGDRWHIKNGFLRSPEPFDIGSVDQIYCKVYVPVKPEKYVETVLKLQEFSISLKKWHSAEFKKFSRNLLKKLRIDKEYRNRCLDEQGNIDFDKVFKTQEYIDDYSQMGCLYEHKYRLVPSNDCGQLTFGSKKQYDLFIEYMKNNPELQEGIGTPNPFLPTNEFGISTIRDCDQSYSNLITNLLWNYFKECKENDWEVSVLNISNYYHSNLPKIYNHEVISYKTLFSGLFSRRLDDISYVIIAKLNGVDDSKIINDLFENKYFIEIEKIDTYSKKLKNTL